MQTTNQSSILKQLQLCNFEGSSVLLAPAIQVILERLSIETKVASWNIVLNCKSFLAVSSNGETSIFPTTEQSTHFLIKNSSDITLGFLYPIVEDASMPFDQDQSTIIDRTVLVLSALLDAESRAKEAFTRADTAEKESTVDSLTLLGNRRAWEKSLEIEESRCIRYEQTASVIILDLDDLKSINDQQGHLSGDFLLRMCANSLKKSCRDGDIIARLGGDEFGIIAPNCSSEELEGFILRLRNMLDEEGIAASVGGCERNKVGTMTKAWNLADSNMYDNKRKRKGAME